KNGQKWFHTGDLAYKDKDDWFYFVDRKKDSIRRRGENIASFSIEKIINQNDKVLECAAYGVKSELGEDEIMVSVVLKPGQKMMPEELIEFCKGKMADFMIPRYVDFLDKIPKNEVHRILKQELKKRGITKKKNRENCHINLYIFFFFYFLDIIILIIVSILSIISFSSDKTIFFSFFIYRKSIS
ncbi:MAG: AMP-binding enzyme, partial [Promethearchaeota archaeon]